MALGAICMFAVLFTPIWWKQSMETDELVMLDALKMLYTKGGEEVVKINTFYIAILSFLSASVFIGSIFSYKNRLNQVKLNLLNTLLMIAVLGLNTYFLWFEGIQMFDMQNQGSFGTGYYLPVAALFFNMIANRFIRKDDKMVRSMDRLR